MELTVIRARRLRIAELGWVSCLNFLKISRGHWSVMSAGAPSPPPSPDRDAANQRRAVRSDSVDFPLSVGQELYCFVVTGGPCAGKTTGMERLAVFLRERGFRVFCVPEAATLAFLNGAFPDDLASTDLQYAFQQFVINTQVSLEESFKRYARALGPQVRSVVLCDRGIMDGAAYVDDNTWRKVLENNNLDTISAREGRYNAVFHLVTAADGAESFYSLANNLGARHESAAEAREQDRRTQAAWHGHPHHILIDNRNGRSFERKMEQFVSMVAEAVGLPCLTRQRYKFVLTSPPDLSLMPNAQVFEVEKIMLAEGVGAAPSSSSSETGEPHERVLYSFIRRRSQGGFHAYGLTTVKELRTGEQVELKQVISRKMYSELARQADRSRHVVRQRRFCIMHETQSLHIYQVSLGLNSIARSSPSKFTNLHLPPSSFPYSTQYLEPHEGIWTLHVHSEGEPSIPSFLSAAPLPANALDDNYSSREISRIDRPESPCGLRGNKSLSLSLKPEV